MPSGEVHRDEQTTSYSITDNVGRTLSRFFHTYNGKHETVAPITEQRSMFGYKPWQVTQKDSLCRDTAAAALDCANHQTITDNCRLRFAGDNVKLALTTLYPQIISLVDNDWMRYLADQENLPTELTQAMAQATFKDTVLKEVLEALTTERLNYYKANQAADKAVVSLKVEDVSGATCTVLTGQDIILSEDASDATEETNALDWEKTKTALPTLPANVNQAAFQQAVGLMHQGPLVVVGDMLNALLTQVGMKCDLERGMRTYQLIVNDTNPNVVTLKLRRMMPSQLEKVSSVLPDFGKEIIETKIGQGGRTGASFEVDLFIKARGTDVELELTQFKFTASKGIYTLVGQLLQLLLNISHQHINPAQDLATENSTLQQCLQLQGLYMQFIEKLREGNLEPKLMVEGPISNLFATQYQRIISLGGTIDPTTATGLFESTGLIIQSSQAIKASLADKKEPSATDLTTLQTAYDNVKLHQQVGTSFIKEEKYEKTLADIAKVRVEKASSWLHNNSKVLLYSTRSQINVDDDAIAMGHFSQNKLGINPNSRTSEFYIDQYCNAVARSTHSPSQKHVGLLMAHYHLSVFRESIKVGMPGNSLDSYPVLAEFFNKREERINRLLHALGPLTTPQQITIGLLEPENAHDRHFSITTQAIEDAHDFQIGSIMQHLEAARQLRAIGNKHVGQLTARERVQYDWHLATAKKLQTAYQQAITRKIAEVGRGNIPIAARKLKRLHTLLNGRSNNHHNINYLAVLQDNRNVVRRAASWCFAKLSALGNRLRRRNNPLKITAAKVNAIAARMELPDPVTIPNETAFGTTVMSELIDKVTTPVAVHPEVITPVVSRENEALLNELKFLQQQLQNDYSDETAALAQIKALITQVKAGNVPEGVRNQIATVNTLLSEKEVAAAAKETPVRKSSAATTLGALGMADTGLALVTTPAGKGKKAASGDNTLWQEYTPEGDEKKSGPRHHGAKPKAAKRLFAAASAR